MTGSLLPSNATKLERGLEDAMKRLADVPIGIRDLWRPDSCPADLLPFLAWSLSIDFWDSAWTEAEKRDAIASTIARQRRKGTLSSLRDVIDRYDPTINIIEWFQEPGLEPYTFLLELPIGNDPDEGLGEADIPKLLADIEKVKPLRAHFKVASRLFAKAIVGIVSASRFAGHVRSEFAADMASAGDPVWLTYLTTELGEPLEDDSGEFLEV